MAENKEKAKWISKCKKDLILKKQFRENWEEKLSHFYITLDLVVTSNFPQT